VITKTQLNPTSLVSVILTPAFSLDVVTAKPSPLQRVGIFITKLIVDERVELAKIRFRLTYSTEERLTLHDLVSNVLHEKGFREVPLLEALKHVGFFLQGYGVLDRWVPRGIEISVPAVELATRHEERIREIRAVVRVLQFAARLAVYDGLAALFAITAPPADPKILSAAVTNWFFGEECHPDHAGIQSLTRENGLELLEADQPLAELVVQSLRMRATLMYSAGTPPDVHDHEILAKFGRRFPAAPTPDSFKDLVEGYKHPRATQSAKDILSQIGSAPKAAHPDQEH
jgi:hypothetical protein